MVKMESQHRIDRRISREIPLANLKYALEQACSQDSLPALVTFDKTKDGGLFAPELDCVVLSHPNHQKDYHYFVLYQHEQDGAWYISISPGGQSKNSRAIVRANVFQQQQQQNNHNSYQSGDNQFIPSTSGLARKITGWEKEKAEKNMVAEQAYYDRVFDAIAIALQTAPSMAAPRPAPQPQASPQPKPAQQPKPQAAPQPKPQSAPKQQPAPKPQSAPQPKPAQQPKPAPQPKPQNAAQPKAQNASRPGSATRQSAGQNQSGSSTFLYLVWFGMAVWAVFSFGPGAILTDLLSLLLLGWASGLAEKARALLSIAVSLCGWLLVCAPLLALVPAAGAIAGILLSVWYSFKEVNHSN